MSADSLVSVNDMFPVLDVDMFPVLDDVSIGHFAGGKRSQVSANDNSANSSDLAMLVQ